MYDYDEQEPAFGVLDALMVLFLVLICGGVLVAELVLFLSLNSGPLKIIVALPVVAAAAAIIFLTQYAIRWWRTR